MDLEPMDVDKSASSTSKMDISYNDTDSDVRSLDNDDIPSLFSFAVKREIVEVPGAKEISNTKYTESKNIKEETPTTFEISDIRPSDKRRRFSKKTSTAGTAMQVSAVKIYHIKKQQLKNKTLSKYVILLVGILVLFASILTYKFIKLNCIEEIDLTALKKSFDERLFGQTDASNKIIEALNMKDQSKVIFLYGSTGVGKTFAVSLTMEQLLNADNVYHYTMPTFADTFSPELMLGLTICKTSILVVDDLTRHDMHITSHIKSVIAKSEKLGKHVTFFLVYNCDNVTENFVKKCDNTFYKELVENFNHIEITKFFVQFQPLQQEHLKKCIENELGNRKVNVQTMNNILKNFDVSLDGCKGVYKKIKVLNVT